MKQQTDLNNSDSTLMVFNAFEYERSLGQANPVWQPVPDHFYPLECKEVTYFVIAVFGTIISVLGIFIGFLHWAILGIADFVLVWSIVLGVAFVICIILLYLGGKDRRRQEKELIVETNRKQEEMQRNK